MENAKKMGVVLKAELEKLQKKHPSLGEVRVIGLFGMIELIKNTKTKEALVPYGIDPEKQMAKIVGMLRGKGFNTYSHENMISVSPPLIINEEQIKEGLAILDDVLDYVDTLVVE